MRTLFLRNTPAATKFQLQPTAPAVDVHQLELQPPLVWLLSFFDIPLQNLSSTVLPSDSWLSVHA